MRVALVHDYLNQAGGAENVAAVFCSMFPNAPLFTSVFDPAAMPRFWSEIDVRTTFMQRLSPKLWAAKRLLPLYPTAFESIDLRGYDLVLSSCSTFSKGVITSPDTLHVSYCHNTTRALWMYHEYVAHENLGALQRAVLPAIVGRLRQWDYAAAQRPDYFIANSKTTQRRIQKYYRRESVVIEPPIRVLEFQNQGATPEPYFLVISRLQSYKRIDLAIHAANNLGVPLLIAGRGPDESRLRAIAGPTVRFVGRVSDEERVRLLQRCSALVVPGREDFGLTALEAQAAGRPVIALAAGGSLETVLPGVTGEFFSHQSVEALEAVIRQFDAHSFTAADCVAQASRFDVEVFRKRLGSYLDTLIATRSGGAS
jgi:glycosyltransferase involved in cell wall biosynthesis